MKDNLKRICKRCGLPETYPGISFNNKKVCNYCTYYGLFKEREEAIKSELKREFIKLIQNTKKEKNAYDCIVAYSGGKDSTFLLLFLKKEFGLRILAHTFDNGFISKTTFENIKRISQLLKIDVKITRPPFKLLREIFNYALTERIPYPKEILAMMSQVCALCIGMVFGTTIHLAMRLKIPLMFIGFTPGQYPAISLENFLKVKSCVFLSERVYRDDPSDVLKIIADPVRERFGRKIDKYFFRSQYLPKGLYSPRVLFPFHALLDYDENTILRKITRLGWVKPNDTDACSTNCLLNNLGNLASQKQFGYHPYIGELSYLVRSEKLLRQEALDATRIFTDSGITKESLKKLRLNKSDLAKTGWRYDGI